MDDRRNSRPRARSEALPPRRDAVSDNLPPRTEARRQPRTVENAQENTSRSPAALPRRAITLNNENDWQQSPRRAATSSMQIMDDGPNLQRRSTHLSRRGTVRSTIANRSRAQQTMGQAGPDDTPQLRAAHDNYVNPGYAELNPAYVQPASGKPVWSLAKPLPRVIRPGMIPTRDEVLQSQQQPERPTENTQKVGLDIDPTDLEDGKVQPTLNPAKLSAQLKDSRVQRENNYIANVQRRGTLTSRLETRPTRASSQASQTGRRRAGSAVSFKPMSPVRDQETATSVHEETITDDYDEKEEHEAGEHHGSHLSNQMSGEGQLEPIQERTEPVSRRASAISVSDTDSSAETVRPEDDLGNYGDLLDLKLEVENPPLYDEIHNNHTSWSVVRTRNREFLAELLGVFVQCTIGFCADTSATLNGLSANVNTTAWSWGFATMVGIYISGGISGAHLNPVITIMLWFYRGFPKRKMLPYFLAQFLGAFFAAMTAYGVYLASIKNFESSDAQNATKILDGFVTSQRYTYIDAATAYFNEFLATAFLSCAVLALGDDQNAPPGAGMNALIIGLLITALNFSFAFETGAAMNPSRDMGPRLTMLIFGYVRDLFTNPFWFYGPWAGTLCGAFVGAALYDICIFEGGESPINYSWTRTKRSFTKSQAKWKRRIHLGRKEMDVEKDQSAPYGLEPVGVS